MDPNQIRNIGLVAHVDAGKTTTTENLLYLSGRIRSLGRVDDGTAQTDWLDVERERGISVRAATTNLQWQGHAINLIDTPGHVDFAAEVSRALGVLDAVVLIVSAAEGVQAHTETLWRAIRQADLPGIIFVNKMDRIGVDADAIEAEICRELGGDGQGNNPFVVPIQAPIGVEDDFSGVVSLLNGDSSEYKQWRQKLVEAVAETDDEILDLYILGENISNEKLANSLKRACHERKIYPILFGASKKSLGVAELLDAIVHLMPPPRIDNIDAPLSGLVFKVERDEAVGRLAYVRLYSGSIQVRDTLRNTTRDVDEKVAIIRKMHVRKHEDISRLGPGDIAALVGLGHTAIDDVLGDPTPIPKSTNLHTPLLSVRVRPVDSASLSKLAESLYQLNDEDPQLQLVWVPETGELTLSVMGRIQVEVLQAIIKSRFGLDTVFDEPTVIYKETPRTAAEGFVAYTMPKPCWAILRFVIEPGERGSGLVYAAERIRAEDMGLSYQREVERRVPEALEQGMFGWQVTDLKVTLVDGEHHIFHTHPLDFAVATPMGIMDGLRRAGTRLLEPIMSVRISVPEENAGRVMGDMVQMRGSFEAPTLTNGRLVIEGELPLATSLDYPIVLSSMTKGRASMATWFNRYDVAPDEINSIRPRRGVDPLDTAKYILWARRALGDRGRA